MVINFAKISAVFLSGLFLLFTTSCTKIFMGAYGIKESKPLSDQQILKYSAKFNIPEASSFKLDSSYLAFVFSLDTAKFKAQQKNHYQPLQVLYYDPSGKLLSFHINCFAGGFPNLNWNRNATFETFLPKQQAPLDSILPLEKHLPFLVPVNSQQHNFENSDFDYYVIVYWNRYMSRQSKRLINYVQENAKLSEGKKVKIIYANNDNNIYQLYQR